MYQATQTFKIEEVDEFYGGVPFEENREPYTGIFEGCRGAILLLIIIISKPLPL